MRSSVELLQLPYTFTQQKLLTPHAFAHESQARGTPVTTQHLERLHRARMLFPLFRVSHDGRAIAAALRQGERHYARQLGHLTATSRRDLLELHGERWLHSPAIERFDARHRLRRQQGELKYDASAFLYDRYQLALLPLIVGAYSGLGLGRHGTDPARPPKPDRAVQTIWRKRADAVRRTTIALCALDPIYRPTVTGTMTLPGELEFADYDAWRSEVTVDEVLAWLGVNADWLRATAADLLGMADRIDPLGDWAQVIARGDASTWDLLRGHARGAIELRVAAEVILLCHDNLSGTQGAPAPPDPERWERAFAGRLAHAYERPLDAILTEFGISPHPRLVFVVEGATEHLLLPRVARQLRVPLDDDYVAIEDAGGVDRDISPLIAYLAPRFDDAGADDHVDFRRPPTRFLIAFDAEGKASTPTRREALRTKMGRPDHANISAGA